MSPESLTAIHQEISPQITWGKLTKNLEELFTLIENKKLHPFAFRRIMTGNKIREKDKRSIQIDISGKNGASVIHIKTASVLDGGLLKPTADLAIAASVPNSQNDIDQKTVNQIIGALRWTRELISRPNIQLKIIKDLAGKTLMIDTNATQLQSFR